ncbi:unnamed protein product [Caenorhabditis sp. 36 PRJEB53466]|nr:unnamed protein product [Caenorhabditis sp. 36 PRJEB53466]
MHVFFNIWHWFWALFGCSLNLLLIYAAIFKSPRAIRTYATLIINFAITDLLECLLDLFIQIRLIPAPGDVSITYVLNGLCKYISPLACKLGTSFFLHCIPHAVWSLLLSFGYRYYILHNAALTRGTIVKILIIVYIPSLFQGLTYWTTFVDRDEILPKAREWFPDYNWDAETGVITGILDVTDWAAAYGICHLCLPIFPVYTAIFIFRRKIIAHLKASTNMMAKETKAAHAQLLKALTFQAFIPAFVGVAVCCYFVSQSGAVVSPVLEYSVFSSVILMPALSPLTYLLFVRPYRQFLRNKQDVSAKTAKFESTGASPSRFETPGTIVH